MGFKLAAIQDGQMCMCKSGLTVLSQLDVITNCTSILCSGDPTRYCGALNRFLVYGISSIYSITNIVVPSVDTVAINTPLNVTIQYTDMTQFVASFSLSYFLTKTGFETIKYSLSDSGINDVMVFE